MENDKINQKLMVNEKLESTLYFYRLRIFFKGEMKACITVIFYCLPQSVKIHDFLE